MYVYHPCLQTVRPGTKIKVKVLFMLPMKHRAALTSVSIFLGHESVNAVKVTEECLSSGSSATLTFSLHSHMSSARREGSEYQF